MKRVYHINRREWGKITDQCEHLNKENPDPTSIFVEFMETGYGDCDKPYPEILEVSKALLLIPFDR